MDGTLFFSADDGVTRRELWKSDGTAAGTVLVKDIQPGTGRYGYPYSSRPDQLTAVRGRLFFTADDGEHGRELWKSDGTAAGTVLVKDINPGVAGSRPVYLTDVNGTLFFAADDGVHGQELWKSDGTDRRHRAGRGRQPVGDRFRSRRNSSGATGRPSSSPTTGCTAASCGRATAPRPAPSWSRTSTPAARTAVRYGSDPNFLVMVGDTLFFTANDGVHGTELWKSDGTAAGTVLVKDINPGSFTAMRSAPIRSA